MISSMEINGLKASFHMPPRKKREEKDGKEISHRLPPYARQKIYEVDRHKDCPASWMNGSDIASSYFVVVRENFGMWLDFNENFYHTHDVAIVLSIQGVNPITGPIPDEDGAEKKNKLRMEQYKKQCPVHKEDFRSNRFCEKCGFEWESQNYITTTTTPNGKLWIDGFRVPGGKTRQYVFTAEEMKGVAAQLIGDERVFAIGIAFYLSKKRKPESTLPTRPEIESDLETLFVASASPGGQHVNSVKSMTRLSQEKDNLHIYGDISSDPHVFKRQNKEYLFNSSAGMKGNVGLGITHPDRVLEVNVSQSEENKVSQRIKNIEIGAGALINQKIHPDNKDLDYWEEKPVGMIYINYCDEKTAKKIIQVGEKKTVVDGFMAEVEKI